MRREHWILLAVLGGSVAAAGGFLAMKKTRRVFKREKAANVDPKLVAFLDWWEAVGPFPITITAGARTDAEQAALYAQGRTTAGAIVTNAATTETTAHGLRLRGGKALAQALDVYPVKRSSGASVLEIHTGASSDAEGLAKFAQLGAAARAHGLVWGGDWKGLVDRPHIETPDWRDLPRAPSGGTYA